MFKEFAGVDASGAPSERGPDEIVETVERTPPVYGRHQPEDIAASPAFLEVEERLEEEPRHPVFHDDQHGTAVVVLAAPRENALKSLASR